MNTVSGKPIILFDMDGPFAHWSAGVNRLLADADPTFPVVEPDLWREYYGYHDAEPHHIEVLRKVQRASGFYGSLEPVEGSHEALEYAAARAEVFFCSTPDPLNPTCESEKKTWLAENYDPYWAGRLVLTSDKTIVAGDVLIDDKPEITGLISPTWTHLLFGKSYNTDVVTDFRVKSDWSNFPEVLDRAGVP